jgi:RNA polymerase sigma-70 factor (ECF subfamily)
LRFDRSGDKDLRCGGLTFDELVDQHWESVYRLAYHLAGNVHDAQDLAQETFVRAIARRASFKPGTNLRAWLLRIASNAFVDLRRKKKTARAVPLEAEPPAEHANATEQGELMNLITHAIHTLDDHQRMVFVLRTQEDLSFREIAEMLGTSEDTARWHMLQARRRLMKQLEGRV